MTGWGNERGTRHERGYNYEWTKRRDNVMQRDGFLCQPCQRQGRPTPATEVDHITPKSQDGEDDYDNLQAICHNCHHAKTQREAQQARGIGAKPEYDAKGFPIWD